MSGPLALVLACTVGIVVGLACCRLCLVRRLESIRGLWDDIYFQLRERCRLVGQLGEHLRKRLGTNPKLAEDIQYLLTRMEVTSDPHTHAAVQNGLVLTVQTAVEQFHRSEDLRQDSEMYKAMEQIAVVDSRLIPLRDRYNDSMRRYNRLLNTPPFSMVGYLTKAEEGPLFAMLIPWWSPHPETYGTITADEIRHRLQAERAPLILAPSQRAEWSGGQRVIQVRDTLMQRRDQEADKEGGQPGSPGATRNGRGGR